MVAVLDVPVSPINTTGLFIFTIRFSIHVVLTVSRVGTRISLYFISGSCLYLGTRLDHGIHFFCSTSK